MKKFYLLISVLAISGASMAQNLTASNLTTVVYGLPSDPILPSALVDIENMSANSIDVACERSEISVVPGSENNFCWGILCYPSTVSLSTIPSTIPATTVDNTFRGDYTPHGTVGISTISYRFYDVNDPLTGNGPDNSMSNSVTITINYDTQTLGIDNLSSKGNFLNVSSRPGNSLIALAYNVVGSTKNQLKVYNLLGNHVKDFNLNSNGTMVISTSGLSNGVYVFCLESNGKTVATKKFVVSK